MVKARGAGDGGRVWMDEEMAKKGQPPGGFFLHMPALPSRRHPLAILRLLSSSLPTPPGEASISLLRLPPPPPSQPSTPRRALPPCPPLPPPAGAASLFLLHRRSPPSSFSPRTPPLPHPASTTGGRWCSRQASPSSPPWPPLILLLRRPPSPSSPRAPPFFLSPRALDAPSPLPPLVLWFSTWLPLIPPRRPCGATWTTSSRAASRPSSARARAWRRDRLHLRHHQFPIHRRGHPDHDHDPLLHPLPLQELLLDPSLRRALRSWHHLRRHDPAVLSNLPSLPGPLPSCAVVSNSGILLRASYGPLIDSHAAVFRLNNARISGFAAHVGAKTNLSFINSNILHLCARRPGCFSHPYGDGVPILLYICQTAHFLDVAARNASSPSCHAAPISVTDPRLDVLCACMVRYYSLRRFVAETGRAADEWNSAHDAAMFHYSSGMQAIMVAVGVCDKVSVFGFGKAADAKHHYHSNQKTELDLHDYEAEYALYRDLAERPQTERWSMMVTLMMRRRMGMIHRLLIDFGFLVS